MKEHFKKQIDEYMAYLSDCKYIEQSSYFVELASNYFERASNYKNTVGITSITFPEIFVRASGVTPIYLFGGYEGTSGEVDEIFPQISDHGTKSLVNLLLNEDMPFKNNLKGVVVPITNDSNRKITCYLKEEGYKVVSVENTPFVLNTTPDTYKRQQAIFLKSLREMVKRPITKRRLIESAKKITKSHKLFLRIDEADVETKLKIFLKETYYLSSDIDEWQREVEKLLNIIPKEKDETKQLMLVGGDIHFPNHKLGLILEETGVTHYTSACCVPYPYDYSELDEKLPLFLLYKQLCDIHYKKQFNSGYLSNDKVEFAENTQAVVFHLLKGQLLSAYYADKVEKNCIAQNIPFICVETDYTKADKEQIKIRIEAFTELLKVRKRSGNYEKRMA